MKRSAQTALPRLRFAPVEELLGKRSDQSPWVLLTGGDASGVLVQLCLGETVTASTAHQLGSQHRVEATLPMVRSALGEAIFGA
jgi:hypothetical protein